MTTNITVNPTTGEICVVEQSLEVTITPLEIVHVSGGASQNHITLDLNFESLSLALEVGQAMYPLKVQNMILEIIEPFNNNLGITIGTDTAQAILMAQTENAPDELGSYEKSSNLVTEQTDVFKAFFTYVNPPTEGRAIITIYFN